jgi:multidrug resistance protein, MATE family
VAIGIAIALNCFPGIFLSVYGQDADFIRAAIPVFRIVSLAVVLMSFSIVWLSAVTGTGNTRVNLLIEVITIVIYCLYVWFVLEKWNLSLVAGWFSEWVYWISIFSLSFTYIRSGRWKGKVI